MKELAKELFKSLVANDETYETYADYKFHKNKVGMDLDDIKKDLLQLAEFSVIAANVMETYLLDFQEQEDLEDPIF